MDNILLITILAIGSLISSLRFLDHYTNPYFEWKEITVYSLILFILGLPLNLLCVGFCELTFVYIEMKNKMSFLNYQPFKRK